MRDLDLPVEVAGVPTLREPDGLAMSSRNVYLTPEQRAVAPDLHRALLAGAAAAEAPGANANDVVSAATDVLTPAFGLDYLAVVDADTFVQTAELGPRSVLVVAAHLGSTRLIDNLSLAAPAAGEPLTTSSSSAYPAKDATA